MVTSAKPDLNSHKHKDHVHVLTSNHSPPSQCLSPSSLDPASLLTHTHTHTRSSFTTMAKLVPLHTELGQLVISKPPHSAPSTTHSSTRRWMGGGSGQMWSHSGRGKGLFSLHFLLLYYWTRAHTRTYNVMLITAWTTNLNLMFTNYMLVSIFLLAAPSWDCHSR